MLWTLCSERRMNAEFPSDQRATLVSVASMTYSLLMIPAAPLVGLAGDITGRAGAGLALLGGALLAVGRGGRRINFCCTSAGACGTIRNKIV